MRNDWWLIQKATLDGHRSLRQLTDDPATQRFDGFWWVLTVVHSAQVHLALVALGDVHAPSNTRLFFVPSFTSCCCAITCPLGKFTGFFIRFIDDVRHIADCDGLPAAC